MTNRESLRGFEIRNFHSGVAAHLSFPGSCAVSTGKCKYRLKVPYFLRVWDQAALVEIILKMEALKRCETSFSITHRRGVT